MGNTVKDRFRLVLMLAALCVLASTDWLIVEAQEIVVASGRATHLRPEIDVAPGTGSVLVTWLRQHEGKPQLVGRMLKRLPSGRYTRRKIFEISTKGAEASAQSVFWLPHTGEFGVAYGEDGNSFLARLNASGGRVRPERYPVMTGRVSPAPILRSERGKRLFVFVGSSDDAPTTLGWTWHTKQMGRRAKGAIDLTEAFEAPVTLEVVGVLQVARQEYVVLANYFGASEGVIAVRVLFDRSTDQVVITDTNKLAGQLPFTRFADDQPGRIDGAVPVSGTTAVGFVAGLLDLETLMLTNTIAAGNGLHSGLALLYSGEGTDEVRVTPPTLFESLVSGSVFASKLDLTLAPIGNSELLFNHGGTLSDMSVADLDLPPGAQEFVTVWTFQGGTELRAQFSARVPDPSEQDPR